MLQQIPVAIGCETVHLCGRKVRTLFSYSIGREIDPSSHPRWYNVMCFGLTGNPKHLNISHCLVWYAGAVEEDDGVLLSVVFDGARGQSYLLLLDAVSLAPVARSYLPHNIPWSAHGLHFPEAAWPPQQRSSPSSATFFSGSKDEL